MFTILAATPSTRRFLVSSSCRGVVRFSPALHSLYRSVSGSRRLLTRRGTVPAILCKIYDDWKRTQKMGNILFSIIWLIILIIVAFWIAGFAAGLYIILLPFTVCIEALSGLTDFLLSVVQFPRFCAQRMMEGRGFN
ncbi:hypothetical protein SFRURICE_020336 [Spodoptera frugiperda]|nr:hypothetical protein SFRURICE_020336 [Spodoptera frugiperda]